MKLQAIRLIPGTKITNDINEDPSTGEVKIQSWGYQDLVNGNIPAIAIHASLNRLVIIDVDVPGGTHKHDGTPWWKEFCKTHQIPLTYTVQSASGGYHFYYALPQHVHIPSFRPPKALALGVDVKFNGYVGAPPTPGYRIVYPQLQPGMPLEEAHKAIAIAPPALMAELERVGADGKPLTFEGGNLPTLRKGFSDQQLGELRYKLRWIQENATITRDEWVNGIFSLKAGAFNTPEILDELITMWTCNRSFNQGDLELARDYAEKADPHGPIGPGTIFSIIQEVFIREGFVAQGAMNNAQEILDKAGIIPDIDGKGRMKVTPTESNAAAIMGALYAPEDLYYDIRQDLYIFKGQPKSDVDIVNSVIPTIQRPNAGFGFEKLTKRVLSDGLDVIMHQRMVDPHKEYLQNLRWDGIPRIETCLIDYLGCEDSEYNRRLGVNLWTALAARGLVPGSKFDSVFVFEGYEGLKKSTFVEFIGGQYTYAPSTSDIFQNLDCLRQMHQSVIVELPELKGLVDADSETAKAFIAKPYDHIRSLWAKKAMKRLRGFLIMGTTNSTSYLQRDMGIRRWWPIRVPRRPDGIDIAGLKTVRDQLFAEGVQRFRNGHEYWFMPEALLEPVVSARQTTSMMKGFVGELVGSAEGWTSLQMYVELTKQSLIPKRMSESVLRNIDEAFRLLGFVEQDQGYRKVWVRPEEDKLQQFMHLKDLV